MRAILNFLVEHQKDTYIFPLTSLIAIVITFLIYWVTNKNKYIKYLPGTILVLIGIYNLTEGMPRLTSEEGVDMILKFGVFFVSGFVSLCFALILGINDKYYKLKHRASQPDKPARSIFRRGKNE